MIENGVRNTSSIDNTVSIEYKSIVSFVAVMPIKSIKFDNTFSNRTIRMYDLFMFVVIIEVISNLNDRMFTLAI